MSVSPQQSSTPDAVQAISQGTMAGQLDGLRRNQMVLDLHVSDLYTQLGQLIERQDRTPNLDRAQFAQPLAEAQHRWKAATLEADFNRQQLAGLVKQFARGAIVVPPPSEPLFGSKQLNAAGFGVFLLLLPVVLAYARRLWVRHGTNIDHVAVLDASPRLERIEQAIESVAIEVERISEAQRFAARLLAERSAEPVDHRAVLRPTSAPRSITPH